MKNLLRKFIMNNSKKLEDINQFPRTINNMIDDEKHNSSYLRSTVGITGINYYLNSTDKNFEVSIEVDTRNNDCDDQNPQILSKHINALNYFASLQNYLKNIFPELELVDNDKTKRLVFKRVRTDLNSDTEELSDLYFKLYNAVEKFKKGAI